MRHLALPFAVMALLGCHEPGKSLKQTPSDAVPSAVALSVGDFTDSDQNRYRDTTNITAYVYSIAYPIPLPARGTFEFELQSTKGDVIRRWMFDQKQTADALREMAPGPGFVFNLSLVGADKLDLTEGEIVCTFRPLKCDPVRARPSAPIAIGPITRPRSPNLPNLRFKAGRRGVPSPNLSASVTGSSRPPGIILRSWPVRYLRRPPTNRRPKA